MRAYRCLCATDTSIRLYSVWPALVCFSPFFWPVTLHPHSFCLPILCGVSTVVTTLTDAGLWALQHFSARPSRPVLSDIHIRCKTLCRITVLAHTLSFCKTAPCDDGDLARFIFFV